MRQYVSNLVKSRFQAPIHSRMILRPSLFNASSYSKFKVTNGGVFRFSKRQFFKKTNVVLGAKKDFYSKTNQIYRLRCPWSK